MKDQGLANYHPTTQHPEEDSEQLLYNSSDANLSRSYPRRSTYVKKACTRCYVRKAKCSGEIPCNHCTKLGQDRFCSYERERRKRGKPGKIEYTMEKTAGSQRSMEGSAVTLIALPDSEAASNETIFIHQEIATESLSRILPREKQSPNPSDPEYSVMQVSLNMLSKLSLVSEPDNQCVLTTPSVYIPTDDTFTVFLLHVFFDHCYVTSPVLHQYTFMHDWKSYPRLLILSMLCEGSRHIPGEASTTTERSAIGRAIFAEAMSCLQCLEINTVSEHYALSQLCTFAINTGSRHEFCLLADMYFDLIPKFSTSAPIAALKASSQAWIQDESRVRSLWYAQKILTGYYLVTRNFIPLPLGLRSVRCPISCEDWNIPVPLCPPTLDEMTRQLQRGLNESGSCGLFKQLPLSSWSLAMALLRIHSELLIFQGSAGAMLFYSSLSPKPNPLLELENKFDAWWDRFRTHYEFLRVPLEPSRDCTYWCSANVFCVYNLCIIQQYRPFMDWCLQQHGLSAVTQCPYLPHLCKAASNITLIVSEALKFNPRFNCLLLQSGIAYFQAGVIHIMVGLLNKRDPAILASSIFDCYRMITALEHTAVYSSTARLSFLPSLRKLITLIEGHAPWLGN